MLSSFVANRTTAWLLYNEAKTWSTRPSVLLDIQDWYTAYCFDEALNYWGTTIDGELQNVEGKNEGEIQQKRERVLDKYLQRDSTHKSKGRFADPALMFGKS